jgi:photosystem II stability/assembly factor-like uncharacterized protein
MCGSSGLITNVPGTSELLVAIALHGLWTSADEGQSWQALPGSALITNSVSTVLFDPMNSDAFWVVGNHMSPYLTFTQDAGATFNALDNGMLDGLDAVAVDFADPDRKTLLVGGHEEAQTVWRSDDAGSTWEPIGSGLPSSPYCSTPVVVDPQTYLVGCSDGQIQRSADGGANWAQVSAQGSNRTPLQASDGSWYWAGTDGSLIRSLDDGQTWSAVLGAGSLVGPVPPIELPDGRIAARSSSGIVVGKSQGDFTQVTPALAHDPWTIAYSAMSKAFYFAWGTCGNVPDDAVMRCAFDYTAQ